MIHQKIINHLLKNEGKLRPNETWYSIGVLYGIEVPDKERAEEDPEYAKAAIRKRTQDIWRSYLRQKNNLQLSKETYKDGELVSETYTKPQTPQEVEINPEEFEVERITTNPNGGAWMKYKKKEEIFNDSHCQDLKKLLETSIKAEPYEIPDTWSKIEKGLFVYTSDKHIGALTKENSVYTNKYDREEMRERIVVKTLETIEEEIKLHGILESLFILELGDALDGFNGKTVGGLRGTSPHTLPQQLDNREQHDFYVELHKELFAIVVQKKYAQNIFFVATSNSNHGGDFEYGAMKHLETYLNVKYPFIKTCVNFKPFNHFIYGEHAIIFGHGKDDEDMIKGLPLQLNDKTSVYLNDYITSNKLEEYNVTVVTGDLHQAAESYGKNFRYRKVLSQYGSSKWIHTNFGSGSPGLSYDVVCKHSRKIYKTDEFFEIGDQSNTGIEF
jgi:hypothetical protein